MNNILDKADYTCSGCGACNAVCPVNAIRLEIDEYGFFVARVDDNACISCGKCKTVCTRYDETLNGNTLLKSDLYALKSADRNTVLISSSGGIASELAEYGLSHGYRVTGVSYDLKRNVACHKTASDEEELKEFVGSKYLQSDTSSFRKAVKRKGFIFGTPCQITGMHKVLAGEGTRDDFVLIEIFCHGVPSYKLWEEEIRRIAKHLKSDQFDDLKFRYKKDDWHMYCIKAEKDGITYYGERETDLFWQVYFENMVLSEACYNCRFRKELSYADIRLGDYWGKKHSNDSEGVSAVFCMTDNGKTIIDDLLQSGSIIEVEKTDNENMLRYQNMKGYDPSRLYEETLELLKNTEDFNKVVEYYQKRLPLKQRIRGTVLRASGLIPSGIRYKVKKTVR